MSRRVPLLAVPLLLGTVAALLAMGRHPICTCGYIAVWHGALDAGNSQHLLDWYAPSHLIHGLLLYAALHLLVPRRAPATRFLLALAIECAWEVIENSPMVIDRYRTATMALGYAGDSVVNSLADIGCMSLGFLLARRLPVPAAAALAIALELLTLVVIRDNLALNVLMLVWPVDAIRAWQGAR